jgi:hypothetical protein
MNCASVSSRSPAMLERSSCSCLHWGDAAPSTTWLGRCSRILRLMRPTSRDFFVSCARRGGARRRVAAWGGAAAGRGSAVLVRGLGGGGLGQCRAARGRGVRVGLWAWVWGCCVAYRQAGSLAGAALALAAWPGGPAAWPCQQRRTWKIISASLIWPIGSRAVRGMLPDNWPHCSRSRRLPYSSSMTTTVGGSLAPPGPQQTAIRRGRSMLVPCGRGGGRA